MTSKEKRVRFPKLANFALSVMIMADWAITSLRGKSVPVAASKKPEESLDKIHMN